MSAKNKAKLLYLSIILSLFPLIAISGATPLQPLAPLTKESLAEQLGWVPSNDNLCGGYYLDSPLAYPITVNKNNSVEITSNYGLISQQGTSVLEGSVTATRDGQQITGNKAFLYRNPTTGKLSAMDIIGDVHLREASTLIIGKEGHYNFDTKAKSLNRILYRTTLNAPSTKPPVSAVPVKSEPVKINALTAWGRAKQFAQSEPRIYELYRASFSTCPPINPTWQLKASHLVLNKNTGRGYATNARILVKNVPIFYTPYINFSIDRQRKSGFLWPKVGVSNQWGPFVQAPFYWNMAPNYDMTITPGFLSKRGMQFSDSFRYLTTTSSGNLNLSVLPSDRFFSNFQTNVKENPAAYSSAGQPQATTDAEINRLLNDSDTRKGFFWRDNSQFNDHWSSHVDFNYAGDDYYMRNFGDLNQISANQLLQEGDLYYKSTNWNFTGRLQAYQTLHPVDEPPVVNNYRREPQLILNSDYPDQLFNLDFFSESEVTHFDILNTPGTTADQPIGNRVNIQPGISLPMSSPYLYVNPRLQLAMTQYQLYQTADTNTPGSKRRVLPIFDIASGSTLTRDISFLNHGYQQTLEPQVYYTYIPYRNQASIPIFDTTTNTLVYNQLFNYNRFSGIDRIGDANQVGVGVATRLIDQESGLEKVRLGIGDIFYFANRRVTLCNNTDPNCVDTPDNPSNKQSLSPISGLISYNVNPLWNFSANPIWNPISKQLDNTTVALQYHRDSLRVINIGYSYARGGDPLSGVPQDDASNNLKVTDISFAWPIIAEISTVGRWSENWNHAHLQNLLYGLQYDSCCWAVRLVGGRAFISIDTTNNNKPIYDNQFYIQFSLKGLGEVGEDPTGLLNTVTGYQPQFGQEI